MVRHGCIAAFIMLMAPVLASAASVVLNEYSAVDDAKYLNDGNAIADADGGYASDSHFGRVPGNGGDWFELIVITDHLDMRNWKLDIYSGGAFDKTLTLSNHSVWSDLRAGTIITVAESVPSDVNYNPAAGDWWINVRAASSADGLYISAANFAVNSSDWQLRIRDAAGATVFGPAGEGVSPPSGVGNTEIFRLEAEPNASTPANSPDYDSASSQSTFGTANRWGHQTFVALRPVVTGPATLTVTSPNGSEILFAASVHTIQWQTTGSVPVVNIEFSIDNGSTWSAVFPPNQGNSGSYDWLLPFVDSTRCRVRVSHAGSPGVADVSNAAFTIQYCPLAADLTGDCAIDLFDFAALASDWLQ